MDEAKVKMAAKLYECRDAARSLLGANYSAETTKWAHLIRAQAARDNCSALAAANDIAGKAGGMGAVVILAAFVEMTEPS